MTLGLCLKYSNDLRKKVVAFYKLEKTKSGKTKSATIRIFGIARQTLHGWTKLEKQGELCKIKEYNYSRHAGVNLREITIISDSGRD
jgi:transposase-like protein